MTPHTKVGMTPHTKVGMTPHTKVGMTPYQGRYDPHTKVGMTPHLLSRAHTGIYCLLRMQLTARSAWHASEKAEGSDGI